MQLFSIMNHSVQLVNRIKCLIEINRSKESFACNLTGLVLQLTDTMIQIFWFWS